MLKLRIEMLLLNLDSYVTGTTEAEEIIIDQLKKLVADFGSLRWVLSRVEIEIKKTWVENISEGIEAINELAYGY